MHVPGHQLYQELGLDCLAVPTVYPPGPGGPGVSTFQHGWKLVDHIIYSTTAKLKLLSMLSLPTRRDMRKLPKIHSHISTSDHLPLLADFGLPEG